MQNCVDCYTSDWVVVNRKYQQYSTSLRVVDTRDTIGRYHQFGCVMVDIIYALLYRDDRHQLGEARVRVRLLQPGRHPTGAGIVMK